VSNLRDTVVKALLDPETNHALPLRTSSTAATRTKLGPAGGDWCMNAHHDPNSCHFWLGGATGGTSSAWAKRNKYSRDTEWVSDSWNRCILNR